MTINIKDISKITLAEDELLVITVPDDFGIDEYETLDKVFEEMIPESWRGRIMLLSESIKLTKITKH